MTTSTTRNDAPVFTGAPGSTVVVRDEEWLVTAVEPGAPDPATGEPTSFISATGLTGITRDTEAVFWTQIDHVEQSDPRRTKVVGDASPGHRRSRLWLESMLRKTPIPISDPQLTTAHRALADPLPYQHAAVRKALDPANLRPRILLADAVGLGKTLEIGMILAELVRRGRGDRILVVTPKHVLEQMQFELWTRFALPFVRLDSTGIQRIRQKLPANRNPFTYFKRVIISIDTLKSDKYVSHLRRQHWDAVVIDESHNVTNTTSQNNRLASLLAERTDALILASATPHNGRKESFAELVRMLEPSAVSPSGELDEEQVRRLVIRRHRHHPDVAGVVGADWAERLEPRNVLVPASAAENAVAQELEQTWLWPESGTNPSSGANASLFPWTLAKAFLSSPAALAQSIHERARRVRGDAATSPSLAQQRELTALDTLAGLTAAAERGSSAKYDALLTHLREIGISRSGPTRAVVFAERVATLHWLQERLARDLKMTDQQIAVMHGGLSDVEQQEVVESFKLESSPIRVLITGDVASEGVNLHAQCHHLIHFDIPWSLIRIEQRNGRIDRYGQRFRPEITTLLLVPDTERFAGDIRVLTRLVEREHEAHQALGDSASLMGTYDVKAEEEAVREVLAGRTTLDAVVRTVEEVRADDGVDGLLARLMAMGTDDDAAAQPADHLATAQPASNDSLLHAPIPVAVSGLYSTELSFLDDALAEALGTPGEPTPNGVAWDVRPEHGVASMDLAGTRTRDLRQRLEVLPQSYLAARKVTQTFRLATTPAAGKRAVAQARQDESTSLWPEAHFLAPLHPVLEWAADRSLATLGRGTVFAVRGDVEDVTVLLQGTLTNARGLVIGASYTHVAFPLAPGIGQAFPRVFPDAASAIEDLALADVNTGEVPQAERLQAFIDPSVTAAEAALTLQIDAIKRATRERIEGWRSQTERWQQESGALIQRADLRSRAERVGQEHALAEAMTPDRTLVRPLLVVVPPGDIEHLIPAHEPTQSPNFSETDGPR